MFPGEDFAHLKRFPLKLQDGIPMMGPIVENWEPVSSFRARPDDIVIATYPKAGTTWAQEIIDLIGTEGDVGKSQRAPTHLRCPFLEIWDRAPSASGVELLDKAESPRMIKTHLPVQLIPKSIWEQDCKVVYVARNAKDNLVSYYHFHRMCKTMVDPESWEKFFVRFMEGNVAWGSWYDHVKGFWNARHQHKILYLFFEDIKEDPRREIGKLLGFLGKDLPSPKIDTIVENTTFEVMKENPMSNYSSYPTEIFDPSVSAFMRKGMVGDWKAHFTVAQNEMFDEDYRRKMGDTSLRFRTEL